MNPRAVPMESAFLPEHYDAEQRVQAIRLAVMGIALVVRREKGRWPTTCETLWWLAELGLPLDDLEAGDRGENMSGEAAAWLYLAQRAEDDPDPFAGVLVWDEGAPTGLFRVVAPAGMTTEIAAYLQDSE